MKAAEAGREPLSGVLAGHREAVFAICLHLTRSRDEAEDATQETFLAVHQGLSGFRGEAKLSTWIYRIAVRMAHRARGRRGESGPLFDTLPDPSPAPDTSAEIREQTRNVLAGIAELPVEQRVVLALFAVDGLRHGQIAEVLGIPEGTVWSRLHLARRRLASILAGGRPRPGAG